MQRNALVSSCLLGLATRYDGSDNYNQAVIDYLKQQQLTPIPVCPEQLAGLPTPRPQCWFAAGSGETLLTGDGSLVNEYGEEVSAIFLKGAEESLKLAQLTGCRTAILKQRSPSCGNRTIHCNSELIEGLGVTAALLKETGLQVLSEEDLALI
jgi:uncharacterized protein YbbK (DUF523 family)